MNKQTRRQLFEHLQTANPTPKTELIYHTPFELLIAVMLSAQATDVSVNKAMAVLYPIANTAKAILDLGEATLKTYIKTIGLFNTKAANIIKTCAILEEKYQGQVPDQRELLEALPGVGRKTANVVLNTAFGVPTIPVDTHVFRVANRTGLARGKTPLAVEIQLEKNIPSEFLPNAHHWLVLHGRYVCLARKPKCPECVIRDVCAYPHKTVL